MKKSIFSFILTMMLMGCIFALGSFNAYAQDDINVQAASGLSVTSSDTSSIALTWNTAENAEGYEVYTVSEYTYTIIGETSTNTYTAASLASGTSYSFAVKAYAYNESGERVYSSYSEILNYATTPSQVTINSISPTTTALTVKFSNVSCSGYELQYVDSTDKTFTSDHNSTIISSSSTSKKVSGLTAAKSYYVRIRAYVLVDGNRINGEWSTVVKQCTKPKKVSISKISTPSSTTVSVTWKKKTCSGYQIQYATNSKFTKNKKTVTVTSSKTLKKTLSKLKTGKTYYVRVRAYKECKGKKYYGEWSNTKKQKVYNSKKIIVGTTLRESHSWSSKSLATVQKDATVRIIKTVDRWYKVEYNGKTGYVYNLAFKSSGSGNLSRSSVTSGNYKTYLDDILFRIGTSQSAIFNYVCSNMSYSYGKLSSAQRRANIHSLSAVKSNEGILVSVALTRRGGVCYNFAALTKTLYERAGYDVRYIMGSNKNGTHCWVLIKTANGYRHIDTVRRAYCYTDSGMHSSSRTSDFRWNSSSYPACR